MARSLSLHPGAERWAWLRSRGADAAEVVLGLIDDAMRRDVVALALHDEYVVDTLIRKRVAELRRTRRAAADDEVLTRRAEREVLRRLGRGSDEALRAASVRLRLWRRIERREFPPGERKTSREQLQSLRAARPGGWRATVAGNGRA